MHSLLLVLLLLLLYCVVRYLQPGQELDTCARRSGDTQRILKVISVHRGRNGRYTDGIRDDLGSRVPVDSFAVRRRYRLRCRRRTDRRRRTLPPNCRRRWTQRATATDRVIATVTIPTAPRHYGVRLNSLQRGSYGACVSHRNQLPEAVKNMAHDANSDNNFYGFSMSRCSAQAVLILTIEFYCVCCTAAVCCYVFVYSKIRW